MQATAEQTRATNAEASQLAQQRRITEGEQTRLTQAGAGYQARATMALDHAQKMQEREYNRYGARTGGRNF